MPIDDITAAEFRTQIRTAISARDATQDTGYGPIRDIVIDPMSSVLEHQNSRIRQVSSLLSLTNVSDFTDADLDAFVYNEGLTRSLGSHATVTLIFSVRVAPVSNVTVQRGFAVGTQPDTSTGSTLTFVTTEAATLFAATSAAYYNPATTLYELSVPAICTSGGSTGNVGANRVNVAFRPLIGFGSVTNPAEAVGGLDGETNTELVERFLLAVTGRQRATVTGVERFALDSFPDISDAAVVHGTNPLLTRGATDGGAVDLYIIGTQSLSNAEVGLIFLGVGQTISIDRPPILSVVSVVDLSGPTTYTEGTDYEVIYDDTGVGGSTRAVDGVSFLAGGSFPAVGDPVQITYTYNNLVRTAQGTFDDPDNLVLGQDLLVRQGTKIDMQLSANLTVYAGFNPTTVQTLVSNAIVSFFNSLGLGDNVEVSDIQLEVRRISGVDNFVITNLAEFGSTTINTQDIVFGENKYARIDASAVFITI